MTETDDKERQLQREKGTVDDAVTKLREQISKDPANSQVGRNFLRARWANFATLLGHEQCRLQNAPRRSLYMTLMLALNAEKLAVITIRSILEALCGTNAAKAAEQLQAADLRDFENPSEEFDNGDEDPEPDELEHLEKTLKLTALSRRIGLRCRLEWGRTSPSERDQAVARFVGVEQNPTARRARLRAKTILSGDWRNERGYIRLGAELIKFAELSYLVSLPRKTDKNGRPNGLTTVEPTDDVLRALQWRDELKELATPFYLPMICKPNRWATLEAGGYLSNEEELHTHLVKHNGNPQILAGLRRGNYKATIDAVNALQETPWRINQRIYSKMLEAERMGPRCLPKKVRYRLADNLNVAKNSVNEERVYFPQQLDFRGRAYCLPPLVNPQGHDVGRSLLEFADAKPLGDDGVRWLTIHLANSFGACKGSMLERTAWVFQNSDEILASAADPFNKRWWMKADKPWRFLAASFEWTTYCSEGNTMLSRLPIAVDGTCNGFQHLSALLGNTKGATSTNLYPGDRPADFYHEIADLLLTKLKTEPDGKWKPEANDWLENVKIIDRKLVKPAVMTTPYGAGVETMQKQLLADKRSKQLKSPKRSCKYLAYRLKACIRETFPEAASAAKWLRQIAGHFARCDPQRGIRWTTPAGFCVIQERWLGTEQRLSTRLGKLVLYNKNEPFALSEADQRKGIVPNFIHSLDAAHLMLTISRLHDAGLRHFAAIHDGYAVHACDVPLLQRALREEFVKMYERPVLKSFFFDQTMAATGIDLPEPPSIGDFDIRLVQKSAYFFC